MDKFVGLYNIRDAQPEDKSFVLATFLRGLYYGDSWFSLIPKDIFMDNYKRVAEALVNGANNTVQIACDKEDPNIILGYSILSADFQTIHWVHVKKAWRNRGIAKSLLPARPSAVTHLNKLGQKLLVKFPDTVFNPFI